jgi:hypothetical protein
MRTAVSAYLTMRGPDAQAARAASRRALAVRSGRVFFFACVVGA